MSEKKHSTDAKLIVGTPLPMPEYRYQGGWGKSGQVSTKHLKAPSVQQFHELRNFSLSGS